MDIATDSQGSVIVRMTAEEAAGICDDLGNIDAAEITAAGNSLYLVLADLNQCASDMHRR